MSEYAGYIKNVHTGAVKGVQAKTTLSEIERSNQTQIKLHRKHLIEWVVLTGKDGEKLIAKKKADERKEVIKQEKAAEERRLKESNINK